MKIPSMSAWKLLSLFIPLAVLAASSDVGSEAPTGFDTLTNGFVDQATHDADRDEFEAAETPVTGLGPLYNATSCVDCHQDPVTGGSSQVSEMRAGHLQHGVFMNPVGGSSLIHDRSTSREIQQRIPATEDVRTLRMSTSILGLGYVEAVDDQTLLALAQSEAAQTHGFVHGEAQMVPLLEAPGFSRVGRFGWKDQHGSLLSFSADADLNEKGITSHFLPVEDFYFDQPVDAYNQGAAEPNDTGGDVEKYASYMRATKGPPRGAITPDVQAGDAIFHRLGCDVCHTTTLQTVATGTSLNGGTLIVPDALGGKTFHPYSDFLLHDVGTGDGIVQNGGPETRNKLRTTPLWGLRTKGRLLHDGSASDLTTAIRRHDNEARIARDRFRFLGRGDVASLMAFLNSL